MLFGWLWSCSWRAPSQVKVSTFGKDPAERDMFGSDCWCGTQVDSFPLSVMVPCSLPHSPFQPQHLKSLIWIGCNFSTRHVIVRGGMWRPNLQCNLWDCFAPTAHPAFFVQASHHYGNVVILVQDIISHVRTDVSLKRTFKLLSMLRIQLFQLMLLPMRIFTLILTVILILIFMPMLKLFVNPGTHIIRQLPQHA